MQDYIDPIDKILLAIHEESKQENPNYLNIKAELFQMKQIEFVNWMQSLEASKLIEGSTFHRANGKVIIVSFDKLFITKRGYDHIKEIEEKIKEVNK